MIRTESDLSFEKLLEIKKSSNAVVEFSKESHAWITDNLTKLLDATTSPTSAKPSGEQSATNPPAEGSEEINDAGESGMKSNANKTTSTANKATSAASSSKTSATVDIDQLPQSVDGLHNNEWKRPEGFLQETMRHAGRYALKGYHNNKLNKNNPDAEKCYFDVSSWEDAFDDPRHVEILQERLTHLLLNYELAAQNIAIAKALVANRAANPQSFTFGDYSLEKLGTS